MRMLRQLLNASALLLAIAFVPVAFSQTVAFPGPGMPALSGPPTANLIAWYKKSSVVDSSGFVSSWADSSPNNYHLGQAGGAFFYPAYVSGGGIDTVFDHDRWLQLTSGMVYSAPITFYAKMRLNSWNNLARIFEFKSGAAFLIWNGSGLSSPQIAVTGSGGSNGTISPTVGADFVLTLQVSGSSTSLMQLNSDAPVTGTLNADMEGFSIGLGLSAAGAPSDINVYEVIIYNANHDASTRAAIISYLNGI